MAERDEPKGKGFVHPLDAIELVARRQLGLFTAAQARAAGVTTQAINYHSTESGRWVRLLPKVYAVARIPATSRQPFLAALLWAGDEGVLSHRAAGVLLGLDGMPRRPRPELWSARGRGPSGIVVHRGVVPPAQACWTGPIKHTTLVRTIVDLASVLDDDTLELAVESAIRQHRDCELELGNYEGRGSRRLRRVLARRPPGCEPTESALETRFLQRIRVEGLPDPTRQYPVHNRAGQCVYRLDFYWPDARLWVELDGRAFHGQPNALYADRQRQNAIAGALEAVVLRFTWDDVEGSGAVTASLTADAYRRRLPA